MRRDRPSCVLVLHEEGVGLRTSRTRDVRAWATEGIGVVIVSARRRREEIVRHATTVGSADVAELAETFQVSASTIRRDLALLEADGRLTRTFGGAMATASDQEPSLRQRIGERYEAKLALADRAVRGVQPGESILLDAGSTVAALAHRLRSHTDLSVTTTSLTVLNELARSEHLTVTVLGGTLRHLSQGFVGPLTEAALETMTFDRVFLGADGVDAELGICEADPQQTRLKQLLARRAREVSVLALGEKLGRRPFHAWAQLPHPWTLVTDADDEAVEPFRRRRVHVEQVRPTG